MASEREMNGHQCNSAKEAQEIAAWWAMRYSVEAGATSRNMVQVVNGEGAVMWLEEREIEEAREEMRTGLSLKFYEQLARTLVVDLRHLGKPYWLILNEDRVIASGFSRDYLEGWRDANMNAKGGRPEQFTIIDGARLVRMARGE